MSRREFERQASVECSGHQLSRRLSTRVGRKACATGHCWFLSTYAVGGDGLRENAIRLATVMEMLHTATLVHDDIIDNADLRRSRASVNARFGNQAAVLMGDWLYMSAFETLA